MRKHFLVAACLIFCPGIFPQVQNCASVTALADIVRAKSRSALVVALKRTGGGYRAEILSAARRLELDPTNKQAAESLLELIPNGDEQDLLLVELGDSQCDAEPLRDMVALGKARERLPRDFSSAVLLVPRQMPAYISYGAVTSADPHSDYIVQMRHVCLVKHNEFLKAVDSLETWNRNEEWLPKDSREWFRTKIFDPTHCKPLVLPEAD